VLGLYETRLKLRNFIVGYTMGLVDLYLALSVAEVIFGENSVLG